MKGLPVNRKLKVAPYDPLSMLEYRRYTRLTCHGPGNFHIRLCLVVLRKEVHGLTAATATSIQDLTHLISLRSSVYTPIADMVLGVTPHCPKHRVQ